MDGLIDSLPALHRLALAYAPARTRLATLALLALDSRLAGIVRTASEPMLAQIRLAWWRDMLGREQADRPSGEPLIGAVATWGNHAGRLCALVDGWEQLVDDGPLSEAAMRAFCKGRGEAFAALAGLSGHGEREPDALLAGEGWAMADLAARLDDDVERELALGLLRDRKWQTVSLPRDLRALAVLHGLAVREGRAGRALGSPRPAMMLPALRIGLFGR